MAELNRVAALGRVCVDMVVTTKGAFRDHGTARWRLSDINATSTRECGFRARFAAECRRMHLNAGSGFSRYQRVAS